MYRHTQLLSRRNKTLCLPSLYVGRGTGSCLPSFSFVWADYFLHWSQNKYLIFPVNVLFLSTILTCPKHCVWNLNIWIKSQKVVHWVPVFFHILYGPINVNEVIINNLNGTLWRKSVKSQGWWIIAVIKIIWRKNMGLLCRGCPCYFPILEARDLFHSEKGKRVGITGLQDDSTGKDACCQVWQSKFNPEYTWYKETTNSNTLSSDVHMIDVVCTLLS
jgi:hypothetical protein